MFYLAGVGLAFFLTLLLLSKKKKTNADRILAGWLFFITAHLLLFYLRKMWLYPELLGVEIPLPLVHGPFLFLYTLALTNRSSSFAISMLHFVLPCAVLIYIAPFLLLPSDQKIYVYQNKGIGYENFGFLKTIAIIASGVCYVIASSVALRKHRLIIVNEFSNAEKVNLMWLQYLIYWISLIWLLVIFTNDDWVFVGAALLVLFIGFFGIRQTDIFQTQESSLAIPEEPANIFPSKSEEEIPEKRKYLKSGLDAEASEVLHRQLAELMNSKKLYCEKELSLTELARHLNTQPNYLSQVINEREGKSFYDFINTLRIEEFKRLAADSDNRKYTLIALAEKCGFNSKSTFNRYFKKVTGQSPSEFAVAAQNSGK